MKRLYHILAILALINLFTLAGFLGYLFAAGKLNAERVEQIAIVLRGEFPKPEEETAAAAAPAEVPEASQEEIARLQAKQERYTLIAERHKRELDDRRTLAQATQVESLRLIDEIDRKDEAFKQTRKTALDEERQAGLAKELELFATMAPAMAKDLLKTRKDADAARILSEMDVNRAKKIIDACGKSEEDKIWIGGIVEQIPEMEQD